MKENKQIILGVTGSISCYKACDIANQLTKQGHKVDVIMTKSAQEFVTALTFQTLTKRKVHVDMFEEYEPAKVEHISLAKGADLMVIAPATANIIAKLANGIADDMLSSVALAWGQKPTIICPAMNTAMYENTITQENIDRLKKRGVRFVDPKETLLACGDVGKGGLADIDVILAAIDDAPEGKNE